jgi:hypothetical protein
MHASQVYATLRYIGVAAGTIGSLAAVGGVMDQATATLFVADVQALVKDLTQTFGDASKLVLLMLPVITVLMARIGIKSASIKSQIAVVQADPKLQVTTTDPKLAEGIPGVKIVTGTTP